jgi:NADH-quinone oxidoreductase subunit A
VDAAGYTPLAMLMAIAVGLAAFLLWLSQAAGPKRPNDAKESPYECGVEPVGTARTRFPVRYYLVALVFVVFDLEAVFIYPWAVSYKDMIGAGRGALAFEEMLLFMGILAVGFVYLWRRGALDWD